MALGVPVPVDVGGAVAVLVVDGVRVAVLLGVSVPVDVGGAVAVLVVDGVRVDDGVCVPVPVDVGVAETVCVVVAVCDGVGVRVDDGVLVAVDELDGVRLDVGMTHTSLMVQAMPSSQGDPAGLFVCWQAPCRHTSTVHGLPLGPQSESTAHGCCAWHTHTSNAKIRR